MWNKSFHENSILNKNRPLSKRVRDTNFRLIRVVFGTIVINARSIRCKGNKKRTQVGPGLIFFLEANPGVKCR